MSIDATDAITNELTVLQCNAEIDWTTLPSEKLDGLVQESVSRLYVLSRQAQAEAREQLFPALQEVKRRYQQGEEVGGADTFYSYLEMHGINPSTFRTWQAREIGGKLQSIYDRAKYEAENTNTLVHDAHCDCDDCLEATEEKGEAKDIDVASINQQVEVAAELSDTAAADQKPVKETWTAGPSLGHISRFGANHALEKSNEGNFYYLVSTRDFSFYVEADKIEIVREDMTARFGKGSVEVKREDHVQAKRYAGFYPSNAHSQLRGLQRCLSSTIGTAEDLRRTLEAFCKLPEILRQSASTIASIQTPELEASLTKVKTVIAALKAVSLSGIEIPTMKPVEPLYAKPTSAEHNETELTEEARSA